MPSPIVIHATNPFDNRARLITQVDIGTDLLSMVPETDAPMVCIINGEPVLRCNWDCVLEDGDVVVFNNLPAGGGGNSNVLQVVLGIVLIVVGAFTYGSTAGYGAALIAAGFGLALSGLIPTPKLPLAAQSVSNPSPTYDVGLAGNSSRLGQPIPVPYGRHIIYPDFAAQPYIEYIDNDAYYHALLCIGNTPDIDIESISIDDTLVSSFEEVQTQIQGARYSPLQTLVSVAVVNAPEVANQTLESFRPVGPFAALGPGLTTQRISIDVNMPKGLYRAGDDGNLGPLTISWSVEAREINNLGTPIAGWILLANESFTATDNTPQRLTRSYTVARARYEVRLGRTDTRDDNIRAGHDIEWAGLRSYIDTVAPLELTATYLAIRIRATSQLSGSSQRKISLIIQRRLPAWSPGGGWTAPVPSAKIAWTLADILRNPDYSIGLPDNRIDLQSLYDLDLVWTERGDQFNGIFDARDTIWKTLQTVARCGRARPVMRSGVFSFVRDDQQMLPTAMFNMRNIRKGSFSIEYLMVTEDSPDGVELEFFNETTWSTDRVSLPYPGITTPINIVKGNLKGVTRRPQAVRETAYAVGDSAYRRSVVRFITEMEGFLPAFGDLIAVSHDVPQWGVSAEFVSFAFPVAVITEKVAWTDVPHYAMLTDIEGDPHGPYLVTQGSTEFEIVFAETPSGSYYVGTDRERSRISIGPSTLFARYCKLTSIVPKSDGSIAISAVVEDERVHQQDALYLVQFPDPRAAYYMPAGTPNYNDASLEQKSANGAWVTNSDGTVGTQGDAGYVYQ